MVAAGVSPLQSAQASRRRPRQLLIAICLFKGAADLQQPITSYPCWTAPADRHRVTPGQADGLLHALHIGLTTSGRAWRTKTFPEPIGSILNIQRHRGYFYVTGHSSPSATPLLVLRETLEPKRADGWPLLMLDDGRVVFSRSEPLCADTQPHCALRPCSDREQSVHHRRVDNDRGFREPFTRALIDRSITDMKNGKAPGTIGVRCGRAADAHRQPQHRRARRA